MYPVSWRDYNWSHRTSWPRPRKCLLAIPHHICTILRLPYREHTWPGSSHHSPLLSIRDHTHTYPVGTFHVRCNPVRGSRPERRKPDHPIDDDSNTRCRDRNHAHYTLYLPHWDKNRNFLKIPSHTYMQRWEDHRSHIFRVRDSSCSKS